MIKVLVNGARGKMGAETVKAVEKDDGLQLVGETDAEDKLKDAIFLAKPDVVVDFTHPGVVKANAEVILKAGCHAVVGTTGLSEADLKELEALAKQKAVCVMVVPNFAIGAVLMMKFSAEIAKYMPAVEIIEMHHDKKADAPSGTAIKTAEMIGDANPAINHNFNHGAEKEVIKNVRGGQKMGINIHSVRLPGYVAHQEVIFGGLGQTLRLRHDSINRESFMPGVVMAIKRAVKETGLIYGLDKIL